ncbi:helix-turn-helix domain-containing protein [Altererythrobacter xixiisoli]|uniref:Helix-turn-helix domain-containing protein n=2 Tax=Croceibacterium xixiisoli TaxID=1476466 RepID=A0A6I4TW89_9SPHN|nr:helix-turn-helix domain-containing protein [Croceibacterium xixiisoli]
MPVERTLYHPGDQVETVYFPCGASLASFMILMESGKFVETALIGREGAVGGIVSQGRLPAYAHSVVQAAGDFLFLSSATLEELKDQAPGIRYLFARYSDCVVAQILQAAACNAAHSVEQRAAKWLLSVVERTEDDVIPLTQEQMASMLGVGRSYMSRVLHALKSTGALDIGRRTLRVRDRDLLKALGCECNAAVRAHFEEVLRGVYPTEVAGE